LSKIPNNPALPLRHDAPTSSNSAVYTATHGVGLKRIYLDLRSQKHNVAYPPRPVPGSIVDLDILMQHCDFIRGKYFEWAQGLTMVDIYDVMRRWMTGSTSFLKLNAQIRMSEPNLLTWS
ncbi:hypothetical protein MPER_15140, partial [Moniliophthora perniciosa FA553]